MKKLLLLTAAGLVLQASPVLAEKYEGHGGKGKMFEMQDTNKDGAISQEEFMNGAKEKFTKMDLNNDGSITKDEADKAHEAMKEKRKEMKEKWSEKRKTMEAPKAE